MELEIIAEMNTEKIQEANAFIKEKNYKKAVKHLEKQADYLKRIGKDDIRDQILTKTLDISLEGKDFEVFFVDLLIVLFLVVAIIDR